MFKLKAPAPAGMTVLVADGGRHIVRLLQVNFERQGYSVRCAFDGLQALEILKAHAPAINIAVLDCNLPYVSGREVKQWIEATPEASHIRVMLMGSKEDKDDDDDDSGPFITKPFDPQLIFG